MGQAWCKEKSAKAQDSKSPLDRVFVRCAHKIYPGLKEDASCLATSVTSQRLASTPRKQLRRGQSIDSVDRPFHPSEWVDVNLEVACEPRDIALFEAANQRSASYLARLNGVNSSRDSVAPVPPPRRRRRRRLRSHQNNDSSSSNGQLDANRSNDSVDEIDDGAKDSDDEFVMLERTLKKSSLEELRASPRRPKNRSTTSLPQLPEEEEEARRPPRHVKTASLPRDASLFPPQTPERLFNADQRIDEAAGDNSIFKIDHENLQAGNVKTSTPVKAQPQDADLQDAVEVLDVTSSFELQDVFLSCNDVSSKSHDSSSQQPSASSDMGYESKSSHLFAERSNDQEEQLSSGILGDALIEPSVELPDDEVIIVVVQRSLSNESVPSEMLIEEIHDEDDIENEKTEVKTKIGDDVIGKDSNELARQSSAEESFKTPPPSPEMKSQMITENGVHEESMSGQQLESALNDYIEEKEKSPEPRIIPITRDRETIAQEEMNSSARLIDFHHRRDRRNPFDDLKSDELDLSSPTDSPPEKPSRLHQRSSLIEESEIEASLIVPTPPRRRHRSHQRSSCNLDDRHRHNDRLI